MLTYNYKFAFAPFRVLQHCQSLKEMDRFIQSTKNLLDDNGHFVFDLFNPWIHMLTKQGQIFNGNYKDKMEIRLIVELKLIIEIISIRRKILKNTIK